MSSRPDRIVLPATDSWFNQLDDLPARELPPPADQAQGLRRLFASHTVRCIPVVSNPSIAFAGAMLERLCTAYAEQGLRTLVVDAGEHARAPRELARFGIRVNTVAPGIFWTPMVDGMPEAVQQSLSASIPFPSRLGRPEEFADLVAYILSNRYLNGETIRLDGAVRLAPK